MSRRDPRRDPRSDRAAESAEAYAESVNTNDAWLVATDAWEEAGNPERARFAHLRQPRLRTSDTSPLLTNAEARELRRRYDAWQEAVHRPGSFSPVSSKARAKAEAARPNNEEISRLEVYEFLRDAPTHKFAYYNDSLTEARTWMGDLLGWITRRGNITRPFGRRTGTRSQHVWVRAINGYWYTGACNLDTGTYCKMKRREAWLSR